MNELISSQIGAAGISVYLIQWLKNTTKLPWINDATNQLNRWLSAFLAALAVVGIHVEFDQTVGILTVTGLTIAAVVPLAWNFITQFVLQEVIYRGAVKK